MTSAFVIVFREGFEAFLIVAIVLAYLRKSRQAHLIPAVRWAIAASIVTSAGTGWLLSRGANTPLWEGVLGLVAIPLVLGLVVHMWRAGPTFARDVESRLERTSGRGTIWAPLGVFAFTALMITREGMETALMLIQVRSAQVVQGSLLGLAAAATLSWTWSHYGHRINLRRFFQVTAIFLVLFLVQMAIYSLHELSEAGLIASEAVARFHMLTEPYSPYGQYGRWFPAVMIGVPVVWLAMGTLQDRLKHVGYSSSP
jgi:high-affinity iron transporter